MINILEKLLSLIYINECFFCSCQEDDSLICKNCHSKISFLPNSIYKTIGAKEVFVAVLYEGVAKELVKQLKYKGKKQLASVMADLMFEYWSKSEKSNTDFIILPVPIHKMRLKERKYNHMDLVAKEFSRLCSYEYKTNFLLRIKDTQKQYNLNRQERLKNIKNAFSLNPKINIEKSKPILIIDDITSTGTTLSEIIELLKQNGYENITSFAFSTPSIWK